MMWNERKKVKKSEKQTQMKFLFCLNNSRLMCFSTSTVDYISYILTYLPTYLTFFFCFIFPFYNFSFFFHWNCSTFSSAFFFLYSKFETWIFLLLFIHIILLDHCRPENEIETHFVFGCSLNTWQDRHVLPMPLLCIVCELS